MNRPLLRFGWIALCTLGTACSLLVNADQAQCTTTEDCVSRGTAFAGSTCVEGKCAVAPFRDAEVTADAGTTDSGTVGTGPWDCVGHVTWPAQDVSSTIVLTESFSNFVDDKPFPGLSLQACLRADVNCETPFSTATTNANGDANLTLPKGFSGFILMDPPDPGPSASDSERTTSLLIHEVPPPTLSGPAPRTRPLSMASLKALASFVGETLDPEKGQLTLAMRDCNLQIAQGVSISISPNDGIAKPLYLSGSIPDPAATSTKADGLAGYANVQPGLVTITATLEATGQKLGEYAAIIKKGRLTTFVMPPTPL